VTATILIIDDDRELCALLRRSRGGSADAADTQLLVGRTRLDSADRSATFGGTELQRIERETERLEELIGQLLASQGGDHYLIGVKDHGGGVAEAELEKIFEPFYRTDTARSRDHGGYGMGLAIARRAIMRHGGRIWAENTATGLAVAISLPCRTQ